MRQPLGAFLIMPRVRNRPPEGVHVGPPLLFAAKVSRLRCTTGNHGGESAKLRAGQCDFLFLKAGSGIIHHSN